MARAASESKPQSSSRLRPRRRTDQTDKPTDLPKESWPAILKRTFKQFSEDQLTTWAAALTYFGVLSLFPMILALVSVLGVIGPSATQPLLDQLGTVAPGPAKDILTNVLTSLEQNQGGSTVALIIGLAVAIWSASGYIGAFMDASNNVWDVPEGRPIWKKIPVRLGDHRRPARPAHRHGAGRRLHRPGRAGVRRPDRPRRDVRRRLEHRQVARAARDRQLHDLAALLGLPERQAARASRGSRPAACSPWSCGSRASALFALYVSAFSSYNKTYGSLGGVIVFLTWLWITNIIILLGAEFNSEMERSKAIQEGHPPEKEPYLPLRDEPKDKD